jgi:membrane protease subunit HflC
LRASIGSKELNEVVFTKRTAIMDEVLTNSDSQAKKYGVSIVDVRIKRTDLPNRQAIFNRMNAERTRMANKYRYEGESEDRRIRSEAEMERDVLLADANRKSIVIRGDADAMAIKIFADALSADPEFYEFSKSLEVYRKAFTQNSRIVFSSDDPLLKHLR